MPFVMPKAAEIELADTDFFKDFWAATSRWQKAAFRVLMHYLEAASLPFDPTILFGQISIDVLPDVFCPVLGRYMEYDEDGEAFNSMVIGASKGTAGRALCLQGVLPYELFSYYNDGRVEQVVFRDMLKDLAALPLEYLVLYDAEECSEGKTLGYIIELPYEGEVPSRKLVEMFFEITRRELGLCVKAIFEHQRKMVKSEMPIFGL